MKLKYIVLSVTSSILLLSNAAFAVTADDVVCAGCVDKADIAAGAITKIKLGAAAVTTAKIKDGAISNLKLQDRSVTEAKIADRAVRARNIATGGIATGNIADNAVVTSKLSANSVTNAKIADGAVTSGKITNGAVTSAKIAGFAVTSGKIASEAVTESKLSLLVQSKLNSITGGGSTVTTYNRPSVTATKRVYSVMGTFSCSAGIIDKEVQLLSRSTFSTPEGNVTRTVMTRKRSSGGSVCKYDKLYFNDNGFERTLVKVENYNNSGTTLNNTKEFVDFDGTSCASQFEGCGLATVPDEVAEGQLRVTGGISRESTTGYTDLAISNTSFQGTDSQTINEGEATEETFYNCNGYIEDRTSSHFGGGSTRTFREICPNVGTTTIYRRQINSSSPTGAVWFIRMLTSYTL